MDMVKSDGDAYPIKFVPFTVENEHNWSQTNKNYTSVDPKHVLRHQAGTKAQAPAGTRATGFYGHLKQIELAATETNKCHQRVPKCTKSGPKGSKVFQKSSKSGPKVSQSGRNASQVFSGDWLWSPENNVNRFSCNKNNHMSPKCPKVVQKWSQRP